MSVILDVSPKRNYTTSWVTAKTKRDVSFTKVVDLVSLGMDTGRVLSKLRQIANL